MNRALAENNKIVLKKGQLLKIVNTGNEYEGLVAVFVDYDAGPDQLRVTLPRRPEMGTVNGSSRYFEPLLGSNE